MLMFTKSKMGYRWFLMKLLYQHRKAYVVNRHLFGLQAKAER